MVGRDEIELFGHNGIQKVWRKNGTTYIPKNGVPTVKYGGGSIMICGCFSTEGVGNIVSIEEKMNAEKYKNILEKNLLSSVESLNLTQDRIFEQDTTPNIRQN